MASTSCGGNAARISAYLAELLQLSPAELRAVVVSLQANPTASAAATDTYAVPSDQDLVVFGIKGYHKFTDAPSENMNTLVDANLQPDELAALKMQNCTVQLENTTRNYKVFENRDAQLSPETEYFPQEAPLLIPAKHTLKATFTLVDGDIAGTQSTYGVKLIGVLIPTRK